jgi:cell division protein FtsB
MDKLNNFLKKLPRNIIISLVIIFTLQFLTVGCSTYDLIPQDDYVKLQTDIAVCRADTEGGRAVEEQVKALDKRQEELKRREDILNKREDVIESRSQYFNSTIEKKGVEAGEARQIQKDYQDTQRTLVVCQA